MNFAKFAMRVWLLLVQHAQTDDAKGWNALDVILKGYEAAKSTEKVAKRADGGVKYISISPHVSQKIIFRESS